MLTLWPDLDSTSVRLVLASVILFGFVAALAPRPVVELADDGTLSIGGEDGSIAVRLG